MIIDCINCSKKFEVNADLIPNEGRSIQCGSCNHLWFFKKDHQNEVDEINERSNEKSAHLDETSENNNIEIEIPSDNNEQFEVNDNKEKFKKKKIKKKSTFTFGNFLSYILVFIISFIALLVVIDTFKSQLFEIFPDLEFFLFSFFETLKDIWLFAKDLI